ncbi:MAG: L,D-transpeptidase family protein [Deltaproteobacteria bacterium]|jgi:murein L,D-transpeptidase YafK|nr:L,D-transpeptidase family protein [Deltaproteobacteria bacterium]
MLHTRFRTGVRSGNKWIMAFVFCCGLFAAGSVRAEGEMPLPQGIRFDYLLVEKSKRLLTAYADGQAVRAYRVSLGTSPEGAKEFQGDCKTPEGIYFVDGKNPRSRYYKNLGVSYPSPADRAHAAQYGKSPGGDIKIHGLGPKFRILGSMQWLYDWTLGCIAVTDEEIDELYAHTPVGTTIEIRP